MKRFALIAAVCAAVLAVPAAFGGGPANKVTADVWFMNGGVQAHWTFVAQDLGTSGAKGTVFYVDPNGSYYATVTAAHVVDATSAEFTAMVTSSTYPGITPGMSFSWVAYDMGEPGVDDYFTYAGTPYYINGGNIQVHFYG